MKKTFILDTNVLMDDAHALEYFEDNNILIPSIVLEELDNHKSDIGEKGYNARKVMRSVSEFMKKGDILNGVPCGNGGTLAIVQEPNEWYLPSSFDKSKNDNKILNTAEFLLRCVSPSSNNRERYTKASLILVSNDINLRIKARTMEITAQEFRHDRVEEDYLSYDGRCEAFVNENNFSKFLKNGSISVKAVTENANNGDIELYENEYVIVKNEVTSGTLLGVVKNGFINKLDEVEIQGLTPKNSGQRFAIHALMQPAEEVPLVILKGSAGTAKTFLTLTCMLDQVLDKKYRKITLTRANVEFDREIGALPGDEESKVGPLLRGAMDNLELIVDEDGARIPGTCSEDELQDKVDELLDRGYVTVEALSFLRGRSLTNQVLFIDEAQNTTINQMKGILTRLGQGSKLVIAGDLEQIDNKFLDKHRNGLAYAAKLMMNEPLCSIVGFKDEEAVRSDLARLVAKKIKAE